MALEPVDLPTPLIKEGPGLVKTAKRLLRRLGPGLITGASDDDPSGIATYSQVGAQFGYALLWTMLLSYPLMAAIQEICGRIGRVDHAARTIDRRVADQPEMRFAVHLRVTPTVLRAAPGSRSMRPPPRTESMTSREALCFSGGPHHQFMAFLGQVREAVAQRFVSAEHQRLHALAATEGGPQ